MTEEQKNILSRIYNDIDKQIMSIVHSRLEKNEKIEKTCLSLESLLIGIQQDIGYILEK